MYKFIHNQNKNKIESEIILQDTSFGILSEINIGTLLNVVDYLNNNNMSRERVLFENFTWDQINFVIKSIGFLKKVDKVDAYNSFIISDRTHIKSLTRK